MGMRVERRKKKCEKRYEKRRDKKQTGLDKRLNLSTPAMSLRMLYRFVLQVSSRSARFRRGLFRGVSRRRPHLDDARTPLFFFLRWLP